VSVDVRIISSTARNVEAEIAAGRFREDLYHRLSVVPIRVPALAERRDDIPLLIEHFMDQISQSTGLPKRQIGADALAVLQSHDWPGNVRQLRNNVERLMILAGGEPEAVIGGQWRRAPDGNAAARGARGVRARVPQGADQPLQQQHLAHRRVRRHGALGAASQAQGAGDGLKNRRHCEACAARRSNFRPARMRK
jgi:two-component system nitrogen regulation response regulator NtrX